MNVYQLSVNPAEYQHLGLDIFDLVAQLGIDINSKEVTEYANLGRSGESFKERWGNVSAVFGG